MRMEEREENRPLYMISVAARLVACHPQTLRQYEEKGLLRPHRTAGNVRLYSDSDIERARWIREYTQGLGVNRAGVEQILRLLRRMERMRAEIEEEFRGRLLTMQAEIQRLTGALRGMQGPRADAEGGPRAR